ncbi:TIGR03089 family protein [Paeniglutamicibacter cryotolerans]|uniref:Uncharacterized protein (TIGR03089 family) n=1 Tax=Paeniglutamicibacter cryotolerans TaxID=670079 RepID=A0A839QJF3_9MICC|nr:TIGR03089 family protein [Paeniglutamicibacter cryotolerans]MBB2995947.1 uncharacterized protein (TIGR03089 family) [Paeniglutamicibacter cryotolerans]
MSSHTGQSAFAESLLAPVRHSTSPWLTWYSLSGERVELSGRVFDNWVAKTANLLSEEFDIEEGSVVGSDLQPHWKTFAIALACWQLGAQWVCTDTGTGTTPALDLWVTADPETERAAAAPELMVVALPSLAMRFAGAIPAGALDFSAEVRSFADSYFPEAVAGDSPALTGGGATLDYARLFADSSPGGTALLCAAMPCVSALRSALAIWKAGDAVVLVEAGMDVGESLLAGERIGRRLDEQGQDPSTAASSG